MLIKSCYNYSMNKGKSKSTSLLKADIDERFAEEKKLVTKVSNEKQDGKATMLIISIVLAVVVLAGIVLPLFQ